MKITRLGPLPLSTPQPQIQKNVREAAAPVHKLIQTPIKKKMLEKKLPGETLGLSLGYLGFALHGLFLRYPKGLSPYPG